MASIVSIANRALQKCGSTARVDGSSSEDTFTPSSKAATEMSTVFTAIKYAELRTNRWKFAITRAKVENDVEVGVAGTQASFVSQLADLVAAIAAAQAIGTGNASAEVLVINGAADAFDATITTAQLLGYTDEVATVVTDLVALHVLIDAAIAIGTGNASVQIDAIDTYVTATFGPAVTAIDLDPDDVDSQGAIDAGFKPLFGRTFQYSLPVGWLKDAQIDPQVPMPPTDYLYEGTKILTEDPGPIYLRYIISSVEPDLFDPLFDEALACRIALELCEPLTQSNSKKDSLSAEYLLHVSTARRTNAIELGPTTPAIDDWELVRYGQGSPATQLRS